MKTIILSLILYPIFLIGQTTNPDRVFYDTVRGVTIEYHDSPIDTNSKEFKNDEILKSLQVLQNQILLQSTESEAQEKVVKNLINGNGTIIEYGRPLMGYTYGQFDKSYYGKITAITEYKNNEINGRRIQFFKYPQDTASVEFYENSILNGSFYCKHRNGQIWEKGIYKSGQKIGQTEYWTEEGNRIDNNKSYNENKGLFYVNGKLCNNEQILYGNGGLDNGKILHIIYFNKGKIDSLYSFSWTLWGKNIEFRCNYIDNTRKYLNYHSSGKIKWIYSQKIIASSNTLYKDGDFWYLANKDKLIQDGKFTTYFDNSDVISDEGYYKNDIKMGGWKFYNEKGELIRTENK